MALFDWMLVTTLTIILHVLEAMQRRSRGHRLVVFICARLGCWRRQVFATARNISGVIWYLDVVISQRVIHEILIIQIYAVVIHGRHVTLQRSEKALRK
jgi:hypothetical protein